MLQLIDRLPQPWLAAVQGALLGDALGVPHEFKAAHHLPPMADIRMVMPADYPKSYGAIPYGRWSDDGSQLLALLDVFVREKGRYRPDLFLSNLMSWYTQGVFQSGGVVFDIGGQTRSALLRRAQGLPLPELPPGYCGNGGLMRVIPVAALPDTFQVSESQAIVTAMAQSDMTHPQLISRVSCALYVELCWRLANRPAASVMSLVDDAGARLRQRGVLSPQELRSLDDLTAFFRKEMPTGGGYVANTLWSAIWALDKSATLSETLRRAVSLGEDTDTVACVAGGLAGARWGLDAQAEEWWTQLDMS